jgi:hypothetical protein
MVGRVQARDEPVHGVALARQLAELADEPFEYAPREGV